MEEIEKAAKEEADERINISKQLSDSMSTITELGRTHAEIQIAWNEERSRKWMDDENVSKCMNTKCNTEFTLIVRKHHCRKAR